MATTTPDAPTPESATPHGPDSSQAVAVAASVAYSPAPAVAYLVNVYPQLSHSFIRREIAALEATGLRVERYSIRPPQHLVDPLDRIEADRTRVLLAGGGAALATGVGRMLLKRPRAWLRTLRLVLHLGPGSDRGLLRHLAYFAEACLLAHWLARSGARHLHAHFGTNPTDVALYVNALTGLSYSFTVHGPEEFDRPLSLRLHEKIGRACFVVAVSSFGRSQLYRWSAWEDWRRIHVVRCGVDAALLDAEPTPVPDVARLVCVGRLCAQKGQRLLVEAAARLVRQGHRFELVLVGDGELRQPLEWLIECRQLSATVRITGWQSGARVQWWLRESRACVLASFAEGLPVVIMESLALGRPVIGTAVAGIPELVDEQCGWLIPAGSVEALATAMAHALESPVERLTLMGRRGAERVRQRHNAATEATHLGELLRDAMRMPRTLPLVLPA